MLERIVFNKDSTCDSALPCDHALFRAESSFPVVPMREVDLTLAGQEPVLPLYLFEGRRSKY